jgi:hypothetical protein
MIQKQEEEVKKEQARIKDALKDKGKILKGLEKREKTITPGLDEEILFKFERIIKNKSGLGIVPIDGGVCNGCHMILPAQYANNVRRGEGIMFCPNCSRILFVPDEEDTADEAMFEDVDIAAEDTAAEDTAAEDAAAEDAAAEGDKEDGDEETEGAEE